MYLGFCFRGSLLDFYLANSGLIKINILGIFAFYFFVFLLIHYHSLKFSVQPGTLNRKMEFKSRCNEGELAAVATATAAVAAAAVGPSDATWSLFRHPWSREPSPILGYHRLFKILEKIFMLCKETLILELHSLPCTSCSSRRIVYDVLYIRYTLSER